MVSSMGTEEHPHIHMALCRHTNAHKVGVLHDREVRHDQGLGAEDFARPCEPRQVWDSIEQAGDDDDALPPSRFSAWLIGHFRWQAAHQRLPPGPRSALPALLLRLELPL